VPSSSDVLPGAAQARFTAAEGQLYPLALVDPDEYEQVTQVVGLLAAELRTEAPDIATVLGLREELAARVPMIAAEAGLTIGGFPRETIADAASAIRCRELQAARSATRWADRLEAARSTGEEWVDEEPDAQAAWADAKKKSHYPTFEPWLDKTIQLKRKEADCIGDGLVDKIGTDQLREYKLLTKDNKAGQDVTTVKMSAGDAKATTDVLFGCTDVPGMMNKAMNSSGQVPAAMQDCVNKALNDEALRGMFTHVFQGNEEQAKQDLIQPMMKCANPNAG